MQENEKENLFLFDAKEILPHLSFHFHLQNEKHRSENYDLYGNISYFCRNFGF
jgi:hypothetical protein